MKIVMEHVVITQVNQSSKDAATTYLDLVDMDGGQFSVSVKGFDPAQLAQFRLRPVSIAGVMGGRKFGQNQILSLREFVIGEPNVYRQWPIPAEPPANGKK